MKRGRRNVGPLSVNGVESYGNYTLNHSLTLNTTRSLTGAFNLTQWILTKFQMTILKEQGNSYTDLFNLDPPTPREIPARRISKTQCPMGQVYDNFVQVCRLGISAFDLTTFSKRVFIVAIFMRANISPLQCPIITEPQVKQAIVGKLDINDTSISGIAIAYLPGTLELTATVTAAFNLDLSQTISDFSFRSLKTALSSLSIEFNGTNFTVFNVIMRYFNCPVKEIFQPDEYTLQGDVVTISATGETFQEIDFYTNEINLTNGSYLPSGVLTVCKQPAINCSGVFIRLTKDEYFISSNYSLYRNVSGEVIKPGRFHFINGYLWFCVNFSSSYSYETLTSDSTMEEMVSEVLTYVGLSVSIFSFLIVLVTYSLFKELRTLPGVNLMNFSIAHLFKDSLFIASGCGLPKLACTIVAITMHYFLLASFTWMSIIAFETWRAFSKIRIQPRNPSRRQKCGYVLRRMACGWVPPFVFVFVCVTLDQSRAASFRYGETGTNSCWINIPTANLFSFVLPIAIAISFNIVFFVLTVIAIRKTNQQAREATHHAANHKTAAVFAKIFILMGFTWILGFLQGLVSEYFRYPFIISTTFTGLYVALAFVFTSRVKGLWRSLCADSLCAVPPTTRYSSQDRV